MHNDQGCFFGEEWRDFAPFSKRSIPANPEPVPGKNGVESGKKK
jgi:hypothetical protein